MSYPGQRLISLASFVSNGGGGHPTWIRPLHYRDFTPPSLPKLARIAALLSLLAGPMFATAQNSITLGWDPNTGSVSGYRLYQGVVSRTYTNSIDAGTNTSLAISNLAPGVAYFFAVTAYDSSGLESDFSAEVSYTYAGISPPPVQRPVLQIKITLTQQAILTGAGPAGHTYDVLAAGDLVTWTIIGQVTTDNSGSFRFTDPTLANLTSRSYLLQEPLAPATFHAVLTPDWTILLSGTGPIGHKYDIQETDDFNHWTTIGTVTMDGKGSFQFIDWVGGFFPGRLYRIQESPTAPTLAISISPDGFVSLTGTGPTSQLYYVEASEDLANWETIGETWIDVSGSFQFFDWTSPSYTTRFYRLRLYSP